MSKSYISSEARAFVRERARQCCEYCLVHEDDVYFGCQVDHIISEKHGGKTEADNLAYACILANQGCNLKSISNSAPNKTPSYNSPHTPSLQSLVPISLLLPPQQ